jgi:hypothetical protein
MLLNNPVVINFPIYGTNNIKTITLTELDITLIDNVKNKTVRAKFSKFPKTLLLWEKASYDAAGDYTQIQAENRIKEILATDAKNILEQLLIINFNGD